MKRSGFTLNASNARLILSVSLFVIIGASGAGFTYAQKQLRQYAVEVSHKKVDALASDGNIQTLESVKSELDANQNVSEKAQALKATNALPQFRIVDDVTTIAKNNNIAITSFDFTDAPQTTTAPTTTAPAVVAPVPSPSSTGHVSLTVSLQSPINYTDFLQFLHDIEQNIPKMQVQGVNLSNSGGTGNFSVEPLIIQMYTK